MYLMSKAYASSTAVSTLQMPGDYWSRAMTEYNHLPEIILRDSSLESISIAS